MANDAPHNGTWPAISYEELPWEHNDDYLFMIPKSRRRLITPTYRAAVTPRIATLVPKVSALTEERLKEAHAVLARFDERQSQRSFAVPLMLLRSESAASSQIENLTAGARNVALARLTDAVPKNALLIAGNLSAMEQALWESGPLSVEAICNIHRALMRDDAAFGGKIRDVQVWIGGHGFSPHEALFVPPTAERVPEALDDLCRFAAENAADPIVKAAVIHAQFETIHPFEDGNGRTGRTLLHTTLQQEGVLTQANVPLSAGLLNRVDDYFAALDAYHDGEIEPLVSELLDALEASVLLAEQAAERTQNVLDEWQDAITERKGSRIHDLPALLAEQPVVDSAFTAVRLGITQRAAKTLLDKAVAYGMVRPMGNKKRGDFYQADRIVEIIEDASQLRRSKTRAR